MKNLFRLAGLGLMAGMLALLTCGCGFAFSPEDLYSLPALPAEYTELNNCINQIIDSGAEYAAPGIRNQYPAGPDEGSGWGRTAGSGGLFPQFRR